MPVYENNHQYILRLRWLKIVCVLTVSVLLARHWYLSLIRHDYFLELARGNHVRTVTLMAPRGLVFDREGRVLVENNYGFDLLWFRDEAPDVETTLQALVDQVGFNREELQRRYRNATHYSIYQPVVLKENLSMRELIYLQSHQREWPQLSVYRQPRRLYKYGTLAAHVLGYTGEISEKELAQSDFSNHRQGATVGKSGIERVHDRALSGTGGRQQLRVDSRGKSHEVIQQIEPRIGEELHLTLDLDLQQAAEEALGDNLGALIAFDPNNGEILAMASRPTFDPNGFARGILVSEWQKLRENSDFQLGNRVTQSHYSPGSIFKVVMGLAGMEHGVVDEHTTVNCQGSIRLHGRRVRCWRAAGHGPVNLVDAIQHSCNVYFYLLGEKLGIERIADFSHRLGLGQLTGVDVVGEVKGLVPSPERKKRTTGQQWFPGETISVAIGQGRLAVTPIQLGRALGIVATGSAPRLHLVKDRGNTNLTPTGPSLNPAHLRTVREAMWRAVNAGGTSAAARVDGFAVCGKTGTVQTISEATRATLSEEEAEKYLPNAWFVGFAPRDNPQIVVSILVQRGGSGSKAASLARPIFKQFQDKSKRKAPLNMVRVGPEPDPSRFSQD